MRIFRFFCPLFHPDNRFSHQKVWPFQIKAVPLYPLEPAKPLHDAQMCGSFYFYTMSNRIPFQKPYTSAHDLVSLLQSHGLTITDGTKAEQYLEFIGYYRLSAYMYPLLQMPKEQHRYKPNNDMKSKIDALLSAYPSIDTAAMGFPRGWENEPLWQ